MKKVDFNSVVKLKLNKLPTSGSNGSDNILEVEVEEMEKMMLQKQLSQRSQPMRMVRLKEKKVIENYLDLIIQNQRTKETRATATSQSTQKEYINFGSQQFQLSNFHMQNTNNSFDNQLISEHTQNSSGSYPDQQYKNLSMNNNLYQLAQQKLQQSMLPYSSQDQTMQRRNGLENQNSFDDYQLKGSMREPEIYSERKSGKVSDYYSKHAYMNFNQQPLVHIEEQSESNNQLNSDKTTKQVEDEDGNVKVLETNCSQILESARPRVNRVKRSIIREQVSGLTTERDQSFHSKKYSQIKQQHSDINGQRKIVEVEQHPQTDNHIQKLSPKRTHKRQALSLVRGSRYQGPPTNVGKKSNPYQSAEHQRPTRKIIGQNREPKDHSIVMTSITECVPIYTHRKTQSGVSYNQRMPKTNKAHPSQLMDKFKSKLTAYQIQTPTNLVDQSQSSVQLMMPIRKNVQSTTRSSKPTENLKSGRNLREYSHMSNDQSQNPQQLVYPNAEGFFDQRYSSKSNKPNNPEIINSSRQQQYGSNFSQRVLSAREGGQKSKIKQSNLSVDYSQYSYKQYQTRSSEYQQQNQNPSENVEEMHNLCVRFHRQLKTIEDGGRLGKLESEKNCKRDSSTISSNVIEIKEDVILDDC